MDNQEIVLVVGTFVIENWKYLLSGFVGLLCSVAALCWLILGLLHKKEVRILELQLSQQRDSFTQFESIVEQRFKVLQKEAEQLKSKLISTASHSPEIKLELENSTNNVVQLPVNSTEESKENEDSRVSTFLKSADLLNSTIRLLNALI